MLEHQLCVKPRADHANRESAEKSCRLNSPPRGLRSEQPSYHWLGWIPSPRVPDGFFKSNDPLERLSVLKIPFRVRTPKCPKISPFRVTHSR